MSADALFDLGVPIEDGDDAPCAHAECVRIARRLRTPGYSPIGVLPAGDRVAAAPVAIQLAAALVDLSARDVAYVDALARIPTRSWVASETGAEGIGTIRWLRPKLAVVTPDSDAGPRRRALSAQRVVAASSARFRHVVVDLTGLDQFGEAASTAARLGRVVVVASALETTEADVLAASAGVPADKCLGVILVG